MSLCCSLFKKTYSRRNYSDKDKGFLNVLKIRAWIIYFIYNLYWVVDRFISEKKVARCIQVDENMQADIYQGCHYNKELLTPDVLRALGTTFKVLTWAGLFHSILIFKIPRL